MIRVILGAMIFLMTFGSSVQAMNGHLLSINLTAQEQAFLDAHPVIQVANEMDWPPFDFNEFGTPKGLCIDYIKLLAKKVGFKIEFVNGHPWSELLSLFKKKQVDVIPGLYKNKEREEFTLYTKPYYKGQLGIFANSDVGNINNIDDLPGKRVGIQAFHGSIPAIRKRVSAITLTEVETTAELVTLLATDKLDAIIGNPLLFYYNAREKQVTNIRLAGYVETDKDEDATFMHVGVRKDWPLLHQILQKAIATVSDQEMHLLVSRWMRVSSEVKESNTILFTDAEQSFLDNHPVIRVQNEDDYPPYDFSESGEALGFSIDYLKLIAQKTGLNFTFINGYTWSQILDNIQSKELDIIHTCLKTKERDVYALFSEPYIQTTYALIVPFGSNIVSIEDLSQKKLAVLKGTKHIEIIRKLDLDIEFTEYNTTKEILRSVLFKECDAAYESIQLAGYAIKEEGINGLDFKPVKILETGAGDCRIGVRKDWPELLSIINKGMDAVTREEMSGLKSKWFGLSGKKSISIGLTQEEKDFIAKYPVIKVSNELDYPPYDFAIGNQPLGYSIDLLNMLAKRIGISVSYINGYTWNQLQGMFKKGELDLLHTLNKTPERETFGLYSEPYHYYKNHWVIARSGSEIDSVNQLYGKTVAVGKGWSQEEFLTSSYPKVRLLVVDGLDSMLDAVSTGKADALLGEIPVMQYILKKKGLTDLKMSGWAKEYDGGKNRSFHFMAQNNAPELISMLNKALASLSPGDMEALDNKWFGNSEEGESTSNTQVTLTADEENFLAGKGEITVSAYLGWMPYQGFEKNGGLAGMSADYLSLFEERLGITFRLLPTRTQEEAIASILEGRADALLLTEVSAVTEKQMDISTPYISFPYVIATTSDKLFIDDISKQFDKIFAVVRGSSIIEKLREHYPTIKILAVDSLLEGLKKVRDGEVFGFIDSSAAIGYTIQKELMLNVKIAGTIAFDLDLGVMTRGSEPHLGTIFQKAVDSLNSDDKQRIYNHWIAVNYEQGTDYSLVWKILYISFLVLAVIIFWNRKLVVARRQTQVVKDQLQVKNEELERLAVTDLLTGLYNRVKLDQVLNDEVLRFKRYNNLLSLIILDIDYFKKVNDNFGHQAGDKVLQEVAATLRDNIRDVDIVGRWGGEEFMVICPETDLAGAKFVAEKLRAIMEYQDMDKVGNVTSSFGVAELGDGEEDADLIRKADSALYKAKENGRNRVESI